MRSCPTEEDVRDDGDGDGDDDDGDGELYTSEGVMQDR